MKKNKRMMIVVLSLIGVIGVSLAYFTASLIFSGNGTSVSGTTATIDNAELRVEGTLEFNDLDILPGHKNVSSIKLTATGDNELIPYNLIWNGSNTLNTSLNYTVYKTSNEIEVESTCKEEKEVVDGALIYQEECTISNIEELGTAISTGVIDTNTSKVILVEDEFVTATPTGDVKYYYIILEYPNLNEDQSSDIGGSFNGEVSVEKSNITPDINIIAAYIKQEDGTYKETSDIPQDGYTLNTEKSVCSNGAIPTGNTPNITINNLSKSGTSCYLYFDEQKIPVSEVLLANYPTQLTRSSFTSTVTNTTTDTIYYADTSKGRTYYFAGNPTDNWVKFGGFYWRIIRINEDGTLRLIYQGTSANTTGTGTQIGTSRFSIDSSTYNNNAYVGYMYTIGSLRGTNTESGIKKVVDDWYEANIKGTEYENSISTETGFCGDRTPSTSSSSINNSGGTGTTTTYYAPYIRLNTNKQPTFECSNDGDLYTVKGSSKGNKALDYPVGLITMDEVWYAGGYTSSNSSYYLYTGQNYWTLSPSYFNGTDAFVFIMISVGDLSNANVNNAYGVRPVINLKADVQITGGNGSSGTPYVISD